mgnify:CR=1 FL=1
MRPLALAFDLGGTWARGAVLALGPAGPVSIAEHRERWPSPNPSLAEASALLVAMTTALEERADACALPIGVALAGQVRPQDGWVHVAPNLGWRSIAWGAALRSTFPDRPLHVINDLRAAAWAEGTWGALAGASVGAIVSIGTGVGAATTIDGDPLAGARALAGELGHLRLHGLSRRCGCGSSGCVEAYVGGRALGERVREEAPAGATTVDEVARLAEAGDAAAAAWRADVALRVAEAVAALLIVVDPEVLITTGGVLRRWRALGPIVEAETRQRVPVPIAAGLRWVHDGLGDDAGLWGSVAPWWTGRHSAASWIDGSVDDP